MPEGTLCCPWPVLYQCRRRRRRESSSRLECSASVHRLASADGSMVTQFNYTDSIHCRGPDKNEQIFPIMHNWTCAPAETKWQLPGWTCIHVDVDVDVKVVVGLSAVLPFTGWPLLTGPWLLNSITLTAFTAGDQTKMNRSFPSCTTEHVHHQRQNGSFRDGLHRSNRVWICCCSLMKSWLIMFFFTQNLHSSDQTTGESVLLVLGLFLPVWDDRTSG